MRTVVVRVLQEVDECWLSQLMSVSLSLVISGMADVVFKLITVGLPASLAGARVVLKLIKTYEFLMQKYKTNHKSFDIFIHT